jgi:hypothetical protein
MIAGQMGTKPSIDFAKQNCRPIHLAAGNFEQTRGYRGYIPARSQVPPCILCVFANDHRQLPFVIKHPLCSRVDRNVVFGLNKSVWWFCKDHRIFLHGKLLEVSENLLNFSSIAPYYICFACMLLVIQTNADNKWSSFERTQ